jgi:solute carrier family 25 citrate transporter 1
MPFDNIKTRIQSTKSEYNGIIDCAAKIARKEGVSAFWGGTTPRLMRLMVSGIFTQNVSPD